MWSNVSSAPKGSLKQQQQEAASISDESQRVLTSNSLSSCNNYNYNSNYSSNCSDSESDKKPLVIGAGSPLMRYKHAVCSAPTGFIYIHGGRFGNVPLDDDVWRFDPHSNSWLQLETRGQRPPSLQEHTLVEHDERLYLFGGQLGSGAGDCCSFWRLDLLSGEWRSLARKSSKLGAYLGPTNRRAHSAVVHQDSMYIFGGFEDFRGSSAQLWEFHLLEERWELRNLSASSACHPEPRHEHSAIVYGDSMFVYGGLSNLKPLGDLWRWSWNEKRWFKERTRGRSPGQLHGHTAIQAFGSMFVFGGERNGRPTRSLWRLNLTNLIWQKVRSKGPRPDPTTWHGAIANPLSILDEANYIIEGGSSCANVAATAATATSFDAAQVSNNGDDSMAALQRRQRANCGAGLSHSRSLISTPTVDQAAATALSNGKLSSVGLPVGLACQQHERAGASKRKSRLGGFLLRRSRLDRNSRSNYELMKQQQQQPVCASASAVANLGATSKLRVLGDAGSGAGAGAEEPALRAGEHVERERPLEDKGNIKILDSLDTDIKEMFQRALSPDKLMDEDGDGDGDGADDDDGFDFEPMSVDGAREPRDRRQAAGGLRVWPSETQASRRSSMATSCSQYQTAVGGPPVAASSAANYYLAAGSGSQRTSCASFATPPSELNTLTGELGGGGGDKAFAGQRQQLAGPRAPAFDRRYNRPKSETVQSLAERADARIQHLYTPFFNHSGQSRQSGQQRQRLSAGQQRSAATMQQQQQVGSAANRHSFSDKSKRHTIHQTMTYYNLYFSEDKSSSSTQSDASAAGAPTPAEMGVPAEQASAESCRNISQDISRAHQPTSANDKAMVRDDSSSSTVGGGSATPGSSGALVGVHGDSLQHPSQRQSQLSLEANSSDSRTLCGELSLSSNGFPSNQDHDLDHGHHHHHRHSHRHHERSSELFAASNSSNSNSSGADSTLLAAHNCPSSGLRPLSPSTAANGQSSGQTSIVQLSLQSALTGRRDTGESCDNTSLSFSVIAEFEEDDMLQYSSPTEPVLMRETTTCVEGLTSRQRRPNDEEDAAAAAAAEAEVERAELASPDEIAMKQIAQQQLRAHKSASSGYESISGFGEHSSRSRMETQRSSTAAAAAAGGATSQAATAAAASNADSHEDSSVRTESSLGGFTTSETTSPEQSAHKRMRGRQLVERTGTANQRRFGRTNLGASTTVDDDTQMTSPKLTASSTTADSLALASSQEEANFHEAPIEGLPASQSAAGRQVAGSVAKTTLADNSAIAAAAAAASANLQVERRTFPLVSRARFLGKRKSKKRYWQLCMFVIGGKQGGIHAINEPITIWRLYI